jgi:hypothetical protein
MSLFKVPNAPPPLKKQKTDKNTDNRSSVTNNFTLASLFSGNFKPQQASTPNEGPEQQHNPQQSQACSSQSSFFAMLREDDQVLKAPFVPEEFQTMHHLIEAYPELAPAAESSVPAAPAPITTFAMPKPVIPDSSIMLKDLGAVPKGYKKDLVQKKKTPKPINRKQFDELVVRAARRWDRKSFGANVNPVKSIRRKLLKMHETATQSPRPSMLSQRIVTPKTPANIIHPSVFKIPGLPVPVFYEDKRLNSQMMRPARRNEQFCDLMNETVDSLKDCRIGDTPALFATPSFPLPFVGRKNPVVQRNDRAKHRRPAIDETRALFGECAKEDRDRFDFSEFKFDFLNTTTNDVEISPLMTKAGTQKEIRDSSLDSLFGTPTQYTCGMDIDMITAPPPLRRPQLVAPTPFSSIFRSPPRHSVSSTGWQRKFAKAKKRQPIVTTTKDDDDDDYWMKMFNRNLG